MTAAMSDRALNAFAAGFHELRPGWDVNGIRSWLGRLVREDGCDPFTAVAYMARAAQDPAHENPGSVRLSSARSAFRNGCALHPDSGLRGALCAGCYADRFDETPRTPRPRKDPAPFAAACRAALTQRKAQ